MKELIAYSLLVCCISLTVAFDCPAECTCTSKTGGLSVNCRGIQDGATIPSGFVSNVNAVSAISIYGTNITISENAFSFISCAKNGGLHFSRDIFEIRGRAFHDIDSCSFSFDSIGRIHGNGFHHLSNVMDLEIQTGSTGTISKGVFNDVIGAGTCANIKFWAHSIDVIERQGVSNVMNFGNIQFSSTDIGTLNSHSFFNVSYIEKFSFSSGSLAKVMPYAFSGLHCSASFEMLATDLPLLSDNAFSGLRSIRKLDFKAVDPVSVGNDIFQDIQGVVTFTVWASDPLPETIPDGSMVNLSNTHPCVFLRQEFPTCVVRIPRDYFGITPASTTPSPPQCFPTQPCQTTSTQTVPPKCPTPPPTVPPTCPTPPPTVPPNCPTPPPVVTTKCPTPPPTVTTKGQTTPPPTGTPKGQTTSPPTVTPKGQSTSTPVFQRSNGTMSGGPAPYTDQWGTVVLLIAVLVPIIVCLVVCVVAMACLIGRMRKSPPSGNPVTNDDLTTARPTSDPDTNQCEAMGAVEKEAANPYAGLEGPEYVELI